MLEGDDEINPKMRNCMNGFQFGEEGQEDGNSQKEEEIPLFSKEDEFESDDEGDQHMPPESGPQDGTPVKVFYNEPPLDQI